MTAVLSPPFELYEYQKVAVEFIRNRKRAALLLDMGLGKTAISLSALEPHMLPALVVAPKRVAEETWPAEVELWRPDLSIRVATGGPAKREAALLSDADIVSIGRDSLGDAVQHAGRFKTFIMDEMSSFKTRSSQRWRNAKKITQNKSIEQVWGLTGTPSPNGLLDLWAQLYLLDGGERLGTTLGGYRERYFTVGRQLPNGVIIDWPIRPGADKRIHQLLEDICLSMGTEGRVALPPVTVNDIEVPLPAEVKTAADKFRKTRVLEMDMLGGEVRTAANAAALSGKLSQLNAGFSYVDDAALREGQYSVVHKNRVKAVQDIVDVATSPVLVFYRFRAELEMLKAGLGKAAHTLDEPDAVKRWNRGEIPVLLAHPASAGHGLNLQHGGHTLVWSSLTWSLEEYQQANKRLARNGQKNPVVIHRLHTPKTVDDAIIEVLEGKKNVQGALLDYLESPI